MNNSNHKCGSSERNKKKHQLRRFCKTWDDLTEEQAYWEGIDMHTTYETCVLLPYCAGFESWTVHMLNILFDLNDFVVARERNRVYFCFYSFATTFTLSNTNKHLHTSIHSITCIVVLIIIINNNNNKNRFFFFVFHFSSDILTRACFLIRLLF